MFLQNSSLHTKWFAKVSGDCTEKPVCLKKKSLPAAMNLIRLPISCSNLSLLLRVSMFVRTCSFLHSRNRCVNLFDSSVAIFIRFVCSSLDHLLRFSKTLWISRRNNLHQFIVFLVQLLDI